MNPAAAPVSSPRRMTRGSGRAPGARRTDRTGCPAPTSGHPLLSSNERTQEATMMLRIVRNAGIACVISASAMAAPAFDASLVTPEAKAEKAEATIKVQVSGIQLVDPASVQEQP